MADKLAVRVQTPRTVYGQAVWSPVVEITNLTKEPITLKKVQPQLLPGLMLPLASYEEPEASELDVLQERKRRLVKEMEVQAALAYEQLHDESLTKWQLYLKFVRSVLSVVPVNVLAVGAALVPAKEDPVPAWATEALSIEDIDDVQPIEKDFIDRLPEGSQIRAAFRADKDKLISCLAAISQGESTSGDTSLDDDFDIEPGTTASFPFRCRAGIVVRKRTENLIFSITYISSGKANMFSAKGTVEIHPLRGSSPVALFLAPSLVL